MPNEPSANDPKNVWKSQFSKTTRLSAHDFRTKGTRLRTKTRMEIAASTVTILWILIMFIGFKLTENVWLQFGFGVVITWAIVSLYRFRKRIWPGAVQVDTFATSGLDYYRTELERRRDHLRTAWAWQGPVFLALGLFVLSLVATAVDEHAPFRNMAPFLLLTTIWIGMVLVKRRTGLRKLEREIDELRSIQ